MIYVKRSVKIVAFLLGLVTMLIALSFVFVPKNNTKEDGMENHTANAILAEKENTVDVIFLGDSESYSSFSPMQIWQDTGYTSYVCGSSAQRLYYSKILLERAFEKQKPKVVFLETNAMYRKFDKPEAWVNKLGELLPVFTYHNRWKTLNAKDFTQTPDYTWINPMKGFRYQDGIKGVNKPDYMKYSDKIDPIAKDHLDSLREIKEFCDEHGVELVFVSTPSTKNWNYKRHNAVEAVAKEYGCKYIDLNLENDKIGIDWSTDTRDRGDHVNYAGAVKVTKYMTEYLKENYDLTDHRGEVGFEDWDESLKKYLEVVNG